MIRIRGGSGLGDSIYLRPLADYFLAADNDVTVCSYYPDVFRGTETKVESFGRNNINVLGHYVNGKNNPATNQWQDICASAGVDVPLCFTWNLTNNALVENVISQAAGRKIILVHGGRLPMGRIDGFGKQLLPQASAFSVALAALDDCFLVQIGQLEQIYPLHCDLNLNGKTTVSDLIDLGSICDGMVAQCSFMIPLAECFDKPLMVVWSSEGFNPHLHPYITSITPQKVLSKASSEFIMDDWNNVKIISNTNAFRNRV